MKITIFKYSPITIKGEILAIKLTFFLTDLFLHLSAFLPTLSVQYLHYQMHVNCNKVNIGIAYSYENGEYIVENSVISTHL